MFYKSEDFSKEELLKIEGNIKKIEEYLYNEIIPNLNENKICEIKFGDYRSSNVEWAKYQYKLIIGKNIKNYRYYSSACSSSQSFKKEHDICGISDNWSTVIFDSNNIQEFLEDNKEKYSSLYCSVDSYIDRKYKLLLEWRNIKTKVEQYLEEQKAQKLLKDNTVFNFNL